jgi:hypothetical protein
MHYVIPPRLDNAPIVVGGESYWNSDIQYNLPVDLTPAMLKVCAERDIGALFRLLQDSAADSPAGQDFPT